MEIGTLKAHSVSLCLKRHPKDPTGESAASLPMARGAASPLPTRGMLHALPSGHLTNMFQHLFSLIISSNHTHPCLLSSGTKRPSQREDELSLPEVTTPHYTGLRRNVSRSTWSSSGPVRTHPLLPARKLSQETPGQVGRQESSMDLRKPLVTFGSLKDYQQGHCLETLAPDPPSPWQAPW